MSHFGVIYATSMMKDVLNSRTNNAISQVNQIGTVTESIQAALDSKAAGWGVMVSHRSGETEDNFIADLSVGLASGQVFAALFQFFFVSFDNHSHPTILFLYTDQDGSSLQK